MKILTIEEELPLLNLIETMKVEFNAGPKEHSLELFKTKYESLIPEGVRALFLVEWYATDLDSLSNLTDVKLVSYPEILDPVMIDELIESKMPSHTLIDLNSDNTWEYEGHSILGDFALQYKVVKDTAITRIRTFIIKKDLQEYPQMTF